MRKSLVAVGTVLLAAVGVAFYAQYQATASLRRELAGLREDVRLATAAATAARFPSAGPAPAPAATVAAPGASAELAKLREEIVALRNSTTALTQFVQAAQAVQTLAKSSDSVATKLIPVGELKNTGKATPEDSMQTTLWAAVAGDVDTLASALTFKAGSKPKIDEWFAGLSENTRQQYGTPEKVIALMVAQDAATLSGMQVIGQKQLGPDDVGMRVRVASTEGKTKDDTFFMHRTTDGWKMVLPDNAVEKFAQKLRGGK